MTDTPISITAASQPAESVMDLLIRILKWISIAVIAFTLIVLATLIYYGGSIEIILRAVQGVLLAVQGMLLCYMSSLFLEKAAIYKELSQHD